MTHGPCCIIQVEVIESWTSQISMEFKLIQQMLEIGVVKIATSFGKTPPPCQFQNENF